MEKSMSEKLKLALYWAASCGGCEIAVIELGERLLDLVAAADIVFWPAGTDFKYKDVKAMPDRYIDVCLFNGAIRTAENEHIAKLLRKKSKVMVAFGSCAYEGCIPALANMTNRQGVFARAYLESQSTDNPTNTLPQTQSSVPEGELDLPEFYDLVKTLAQTVKVDYYVPGCPPVADQVWNVLQAVIAAELPEPGSVVGAWPRNVCDECERIREGTKVKRFVRPHQVIADPKRCFLEQGIICAGPATRAGCGRPCIHAGMPCRGCYGPPDGVLDQGSKLLSAVIAGVDPEVDVQEAIADIVDPTGTFYRFSLADSLMQTMKYGVDKVNVTSGSASNEALAEND
jgi:F420-non-reducing hydrogenase small subunit